MFACLLFGCSCSVRNIYPSLGATVGGGVGALAAGPGGAAVGALGGNALGEVLRAGEEVDDVKEQLEAVTEGQVKKLIESKVEEQKSWFDKVVQGIYDLLKIAAIGAILIFVVPILYTKFHIKRLKNGQ